MGKRVFNNCSQHWLLKYFILVVITSTALCFGFILKKANIKIDIDRSTISRLNIYQKGLRNKLISNALFSTGTEISTDNSPESGDTNVANIELRDEIRDSFMSYALSTILGRALPDVRDGLKPVHRRVLYAMHVLNLTPESGYRKCARVVGEVLGKFHPHGDQSVYDALVRMAQDFVMLHPLVSGHGNFGSIDDDPAAAMRYTECKLSPISFDSLLTDIDEETVEFIPNFDGTEVEPRILPAKLPLLLLNGASGIAVGMATSIPPHNLGEIVNALNALINNPSLSDDDLLKIIPAPDFPTGAFIMGKSGAEKLYKTGSGSITLRAVSHIETTTANSKSGARARTSIIITELPYMTNKASLLEKIADLVNDKKLEGISDIRDESDRDGIRVVIEVKRDAVAAIVQNNLYKKTTLQTTFSGSMLAVVDDGKQPQKLTLRKLLELFIEFRFDTVRKRSAFRLRKLQNRAHIVEGMLKALKQIDAIIECVRSSNDNQQIKSILTSDKFGFTATQCDSILALKLGRLTSLEETKMNLEQAQLLKDIEYYNEVMSDRGKVFEIIKLELDELKGKYGVPRKSKILDDEGGILSDQDLVTNDRSVIIMTHSGYIKRILFEEFEAQSRGGKGKLGTKLSTDEDSVSHFFTCNNHDSLLFISNKGIAVKIKAFQVPVASRTAKGVPIPQVLPIGSEEKITSVIPIDNFSDDDDLILLTSQGYVKRTPIKAFESISSRGLIIISLRENDSLRWVRRCKSNDAVVVATRDGFATRFAVLDLPLTGRNSMGLQALSIGKGDEVADMDILVDANTMSPLYFLAVTDKGFGKRIPIDEFRIKKRRGAGVTAIKFKEKVGGNRRISRIEGKSNYESDALRCMRVCYPGDEIALSTSKGAIVRQKVDDLSIQSRTATGVMIQKIAADDSIVMVDIVRASLEKIS